MFDFKHWKFRTLFVAVVLILMLGAIGCGEEEEALNGEVRKEEVNGEKENDDQEEVNGKQEAAKEEDKEEVDEDNPYEEAEEIVPMEDRIITMDEEFSSVLEEVFEKEPKLVSTGDIQPLDYVVNRVITTDDVTKIKDLLEEKGYETVDSSIEGNEYEFDISITEEILEEKYEGDVGGNMYVVIWTAEEGENAQKIYVRTL